jgi:cyclic pyranopterin phosphate synthase
MPARTRSVRSKSKKLSHVDRRGRARMVDVSAKTPSARTAVARATVRARPATVRLLSDGRIPKGDVVAAARIAGIMAAKRTPELVPLCHPLPLSAVELDVVPDPTAACVHLESRVRLVAKTGAEMEALVAVSVAALTIYDMCKAVDREMVIDAIRLVHKSGGKSGTYTRRDEKIA